MRNYVQRGNTLTVTAPYALLSGGGCQVGNIFGVSVNNQNVGDSTELVVEGVFDLAKDNSTFTSGAKVYWDNAQHLTTANTLTAAGAANKEIGFAVLDQPSGVAAPGGQAADLTVRVRLNPLSFGPVSTGDIDPAVSLQKATVTLTAAQLDAMNGTPQAILPAPDANHMLVINQVILEAKVDTPFSGGGNIFLQYHDTALQAQSGTVATGLLLNAGTYIACLGPLTGTGFLPFAVPAGLGVDISNANAAFTGGAGTLVVTVFYSVLPV